MPFGESFTDVDIKDVIKLSFDTLKKIIRKGETLNISNIVIL